MIDDKQIEKLKELIDCSNNIVFFGGAGVSTESGIPDFRSPKNYKREYKYSFETILSHDFFEYKPEEFYDYYYSEMIKQDAKPNNAHKMIAYLESIGKIKACVTQNIDGLHQDAGSRNVFELHGSVRRNTCTRCGKHFDSLQDIICRKPLPRCECGGIIKPDVVLYGEMLNDDCVNGAINAIKKSDLVIVGGTSLVVYPAAGFLYYARGKIVVINKTSVMADRKIDLEINEPIGEVFTKLAEKMGVKL